MSASHRTTLICSYRYDPLDRLVGSIPYQQASIQRFYCRNRLATEIQGGVQCSIFQHAEHLLAQQQSHDAKVDSHLLATDTQRSVLTALDGEVAQQFAYSPYGHRPSEHDTASLHGFNGERLDPFTRHYHLGNGYRQFNAVLMRFNSPDNQSPFGEGGVNAYAYCEGDPRNWADESGHGRIPTKVAQSALTSTNIVGALTPSVETVEVATSVRTSRIQKSKRAMYYENGRKKRQQLVSMASEGNFNERSYWASERENLSYITEKYESNYYRSLQGYQDAKQNYGFESSYPSSGVLRQSTILHGRAMELQSTLPDVRHFDVTISYIKNRYRVFNRSSDYYRIRQLEIDRITYINNFTRHNFFIRDS